LPIVRDLLRVVAHQTNKQHIQQDTDTDLIAQEPKAGAYRHRKIGIFLRDDCRKWSQTGILD